MDKTEIEISLTDGTYPVCDFCSNPGVVYECPCDNFSIPPQTVLGIAMPEWRNVSYFAACATCGTLILTGDRDALWAHSKATTPVLKAFPPEMRDTMAEPRRQVQDGYWKHRQGEPRLFERGEWEAKWAKAAK